jgi:hypothetical protein
MGTLPNNLSRKYFNQKNYSPPLFYDFASGELSIRIFEVFKKEMGNLK